MDADEVFQCYECGDGVQIFATEEALITHKWDMIRATKRKSHMCCHVCKLDHRTFEALVRHYQLNHPAKQQLSCPGCSAPFTRLHSLMYHLDNDACPHILASRVKESRALQVQATNLLANAATKAALEGGGGSVRDDGGFNVNEASADGVVAPDVAVSRSTQLGIFNHSGVTVGDFGRFININPHEAAAVAAESKLEAVRTTTASGIRGNLVDQNENGGNQVPPTSHLASAALLLRRQRLMGVGGIVDPDRNDKKNGKGKGKASEDDLTLGTETETDVDNLKQHQAVRNFRHGDSKAPDLLTDDNLSTINQRFQGLNVWAGQAMLKPETALHHGGGGEAASGSATPAPQQTPRVVPVTGPVLGAGLANLAGLAGLTGLSSQSVPEEVKAAVKSWWSAADGRQPASDVGIAGSTIGIGSRAASAKMRVTIHHPDHPDFDIYRYENKINHRFNCPYPVCKRVGKLFKTAKGLYGHLRSETAHSKVRVQCPSCFDMFETVNALMQHCESQSSRCQFRESDDYIPFLNILSAGVAEIHGRNVDMTLSYKVQEGAAQMLLMDECQDTQSQAHS